MDVVAPSRSRGALTSGSGPKVAFLFHRALAAIQAVAFASLGVQAGALIGSRGLVPWAEVVPALDAGGVTFWQLPTLLRYASGDRPLTLLPWLGVGLALAALVGLWPRLLLAMNALLYLSFMNAGGVFFRFQWDILLLESSLLAALLPADREAPLAHLGCRLLLFKLYFESGIAKVLSPDWRDGSAMAAYYETAPLPTRLAFWAHHLPAWWHHVESLGTLGLELLVPLFLFGPRALRRVALVALTGFQLLNLATANYGFFVDLALALHLFLLDDADLPFSRPVKPGRAGSWRGGVMLAGYAGLSLVEAGRAFAPGMVPPLARRLAAAEQPFSLVNVFHLFGSITTERLEPTVELHTPQGWQAQPLRHKPGDPFRAPDVVAPHQPRLDFQLWFYGLAPESTPPYVAGLLVRLCTDPSAVAGFFAGPLPPQLDAARITFAPYTFASPGEHRATGRWWDVGPAQAGPTLPCSRVRPPLRGGGARR